LTIAGIVSNPGETTDSVPLTVYYKFMLDSAGFLSEWVLQAPSLLFGMLTVIVLPIAVRRLAGHRASLVFAWLLAISPLLIFYSRLARPYAFIPILTLGGVMAFIKWIDGDGRKWAVIYVICAVAAPYLHLTALPFLAAPLFILPVEKLWERYRAKPPASVPVRPLKGNETAWVFAIVPTLSALLIYFVLIDKSGTFSAKIAKNAPTAGTYIETIGLFYGTGFSWLAAALSVAGVIGAWQIVKQRRRFALYVFTACAFQVVFIVISSPFGSNAAIVFVRYMLSLLAVMLLVSAVGLVKIDE
jgi:uncharacterized membrane protein